VPRHFGYDPHPHRGDRFSHRPDFSPGGSYTHFERRHLNGPHFLHRVSHPTGPSGEVQKIVKLPHVAWLSVEFLRFISLTPALSHQPLLILCRCWTEDWRICG
jgi:hypothetical protein